MKLWLPRYCIRCGKPLADDKQASAFFESAACKQAWQRARAYTRTSPLFAAFEERMKRYAGIAYWYRLAFRYQGQAWLYPTTKEPSLRFDGLRRATPGFRIRPFEPPVIPIRQPYYIALSTEPGGRVPLPTGDGGPSETEPCRAIRVEDGERAPGPHSSG